MTMSTQQEGMSVLREHSYSCATVNTSVPAILEWDTPLSFPVVIHVLAESDGPDDTGHPRHASYVPVTRGDQLYPHWLQGVMGKDLRFYTTLDAEEIQKAIQYEEGRFLVQKLRYLSVRFSWDPNNPVGLQLLLAENHGNRRLHRRRQQKALKADCILVDKKTDCVAIQGSNFSVMITPPSSPDAVRNKDDMGSKIGVGMFTRCLDSVPHVRVRWYISLPRADFPTHVLEAAIAQERNNDGNNNDDDDDDDVIDVDQDEDVIMV